MAHHDQSGFARAWRYLVAGAISLGCVFAGPLAAAETAPTPATQWPVYTDVLAPFVDKMANLPDMKDPQLRAEMYKFVYADAAWAVFGQVYADPNYPDFWPIYNQVFNFGFENPDDAYYMTAVSGDGVYKISGTRGTVRIVNFQIGTNTTMLNGVGPVTTEELTPPAAEYELGRDAHVKKDGTFEFILSGTRPDGYKGDWLKLDPHATFILVRQRSYDWLTEVDGRLAIDRLDRPAIKPRPSAQEIETRLKNTSLFVENQIKLLASFPGSMRKKGLINKIVPMPQPAGLTTQKYVMGMFDLQPDEALIIDTEIPKQCHYWMFHLTDEMMTAIDPMNRETSLNGSPYKANGYSAHLDKDGKFRAVVSAQDPGVPNWLDTGGLGKGSIIGRWWACDSWPQPVVTKVKVADIRKSLPADTPVITAEQRDAAVRLRRKGAQMRRRW